MAVGLYKMGKPSPFKEPVTLASWAASNPQLAVAGVSAVGSIISGIFGRKKRRREQAEAKKEMLAARKRWESLDFSNPYANMENPYEDLAVNQQQAEFLAQEGRQQRADILQTLRTTAGGAGIAGLAQALAGQGQVQSQKISSLIADQEAKNQRLRAKGASEVQRMERYGEAIKRGWEKEREETLFGMSMQRTTAANLARARAKQQMWGGLGTLTGVGMLAGQAMSQP